MSDNNRRTTTEGGISIPPVPNNNSGVELITKPEIEHIEPIEMPVLENVEPTASFAVDISINIDEKIDPLLKSACIVHFRPRGNSWKSESFGFDWVRIGDSGMWSDNDNKKISKDSNIKCETYSLRLTGKYYENGTNNVCDDGNKWLHMKDTTKLCSFRNDLTMYSNLIKNSFPIAYTIPWKAIIKQNQIQFDSSVTDEAKRAITRCNYTYYAPLLFIRRNNTAKLKLRIEHMNGEALPVRLELREHTEDRVASSPPNFTFSPTNGVFTPCPSDNYNIEITCTQIINEFKQIDAIAVYDNPANPGTMIEKLCGQLRVYPNNNIRTLKILPIRVKTVISGSTETGSSLTRGELTEMSRLLNNLCLVDTLVATEYVLEVNNIVNDVPWQGDTFPCDLRQWFDFVSLKIKTRGGLEAILLKAFSDDIIAKANNAPAGAAGDELRRTNRYDDYIKVFIFNLEKIDTAGEGSHEDGTVILYNGRQSQTLVHELIHTAGLPHTFAAPESAAPNKAKDPSRNALFTYTAQKTENIMDYSHMVGKDRYSVFYWQIRKIWDFIDRQQGRTIVLPTEQSNKITIGRDTPLIPFQSI